MTAPNPIAAVVLIAPLMLDDLRDAATYLESIADGPALGDARQHALRLWAASQAVERLIGAVEQLGTVEGNGKP